MFIASEKLFSLFERYKQKKFYFVEPEGNWGDFLICMGALKLAKRIGLDYEYLSGREFMQRKDFECNSVVYIQGGGSFNDIWNGDPVEAFVKAVHLKGLIIIVGPSTFIEDPEFLSEKIIKRISDRKAEEIHVFTREMVSYEVLKNLLPSDIKLSAEHDTALNLTKDDFGKITPARIYNDIYLIREDKEKVGFMRPHPFVLWIDPIRYCENFDDWVKIHVSARRIYTNRLHSAILSSIFNKEVTLLPNNYHKNRSVWEYSLQSRQVQWLDTIKVNRIIKTLYKTTFYKKFVNSYKVNTLSHLFVGRRVKGVGGN